MCPLVHPRKISSLNKVSDRLFRSTSATLCPIHCLESSLPQTEDASLGEEWDIECLNCTNSFSIGAHVRTSAVQLKILCQFLRTGIVKTNREGGTECPNSLKNGSFSD